MAENTSWVTAEDARRLSDELHQWFKDRAEQEARLVAPKAIEYGSRSMIAQGRGLADYGNKTFDISDQDAFELAVWDMVRLKVGRWTEAVMHGKPVSDDTLLDIGIYVKMAQRNREAGSWPGVKAHEMQANIDALKGICDPPVEKIETPFRMVDGIPRVIPTEAEDDDHHTFEVAPDWKLVHRGNLVDITNRNTPQWDLVRTEDNHTRKQLVQDKTADGRYYNHTRPDPQCSGYHVNGHCLRPVSYGSTLFPKLPETRKEETK